MARTHTFKGSASAGYGYFAYIEDGQLVIAEDWGQEGRVLFRGTYEEAVKQGWLSKIWRERHKLFSAIEEYYTKDAKKVNVSDAAPVEETTTKQFKDSRDLHGNGWYGYIEKYISQKHAKTDLEKLKKDHGFDEETKTILFKVKIYNKNGAVHNCLVRGRFQADVIKKLMPSIPEVLTIETCHADVFAIRSSEISAAEFVDKWDWEA